MEMNTDNIKVKPDYNKYTPLRQLKLSGIRRLNSAQLVRDASIDDKFKLSLVDDHIISEDELNSNNVLALFSNSETLDKIQYPMIINVAPTEPLVETDTPDENYSGSIVILEKEDRELLERLVRGEAGNEGFIGAALVAQAIRDTIVYRGYDSVADVRQKLKYAGSIKKEPNQDVKDAVSYIFDQGGVAVKHKIIYFYAPDLVDSPFHESLQFITEYGCHRFFYAR